MKKILFMACLTAMVFVGVSCTGKESASSAKPLPADCFSYTLTDDGKGIVIRNISSKGDEVIGSVLNIPSEIEGLPVKYVCQPAFTSSKRGGLLDPPWDSVIIPDEVTVVYVVEYNNTVFPSAPSISTKKLILGKNVQFPYSYRFCDLEEFVVPESVTKLGQYSGGTFTTAVIPEHIKEIPEEEGFSYCDNLKEITFPDGIKIDKYAYFPMETLSVKTQKRLRELGYKK